MTTDVKKAFVDYQTDFDVCESIIKKHSKSFYTAFSQLPEEKAKSVYAIYAFCRLADDAIDVQKDPELLQELRSELTDFDQGHIPNKPVWRALSVVFHTFEMDITPFYDMLSGQSMDIQFIQPESYEQLSRYCYYVAGSVGLMLLPILSTNSAAIQIPAKQLGEAMQLTNILRDIGEDFTDDRIYLPKKMMNQYHVSTADLATHTPSTNFIQLWEDLAVKAENLYLASLKMMPQIDKDCRQALLSALFIYRAQLTEIRKNNYDVFQGKTTISNLKKIQLIKEVKKYLQELTLAEL